MTKSLAELLESARMAVTCIDVETAKALLGQPLVRFVDVREASELPVGGIIPGAIHVPRSNLEWLIDPKATPTRFGHDEQLVFVCAGGGRSLLSAARALEMGYQRVMSLDGGFRGWLAANGPVVPAPI